MSVGTVPVELSIPDSTRRPVAAELSVETLTPAERLARAGKVAAVGLAVTVVFVFVPLVHFLAVPLGLVATAVATAGSFRKSVRVISMATTCPKCGSSTPVEPGALGWPLSLSCPTCGTTFRARATGGVKTNEEGHAAHAGD